MRKKGEAVLDAKYDGKKGSRAAIFGGDEDTASEDEEEEGDLEDDEDEDDEMGSYEDLEAEEAGDSEDDDESESDEEVDSEEDLDDDEEDAVPKRKASATTGTSSRAKVQDERAMVSQLKQAASADVEKGRAVKKQLVRLLTFFPSCALRTDKLARSVRRHSATRCSSLGSNCKRRSEPRTCCRSRAKRRRTTRRSDRTTSTRPSATWPA